MGYASEIRTHAGYHVFKEMKPNHDAAILNERKMHCKTDMSHYPQHNIIPFFDDSPQYLPRITIQNT